MSNFRGTIVFCAIVTLSAWASGLGGISDAVGAEVDTAPPEICIEEFGYTDILNSRGGFLIRRRAEDVMEVIWARGDLVTSAEDCSDEYGSTCLSFGPQFILVAPQSASEPSSWDFREVTFSIEGRSSFVSDGVLREHTLVRSRAAKAASEIWYYHNTDVGFETIMLLRENSGRYADLLPSVMVAVSVFRAVKKPFGGRDAACGGKGR